MRFMVVERFTRCGRMLPEGVRYLDSWVAADGSHCYQLMECDKESDLRPWLDAWADLVDFEVVAVTDSAGAASAFRG